jgi:hypothetical protein
MVFWLHEKEQEKERSRENYLRQTVVPAFDDGMRPCMGRETTAWDFTNARQVGSAAGSRS